MGEESHINFNSPCAEESLARDHLLYGFQSLRDKGQNQIRTFDFVPDNIKHK